MLIETAQLLNEINKEFYSSQADSFSSTRHGSWSGWDRVFSEAGYFNAPETVADIACGNMRFEHFLSQRFPRASISACCIDSCQELEGLSVAQEGVGIQYRNCDLIELLLNGQSLELPAAQLVVCFGFMHHVPSKEKRVELLKQLWDSVSSGGTLAVSFWQFMTVDSIASQAHALTEETARSYGIDLSDLDEDDWFLGWQNSESRRYCHCFDMDQVADLASAAGIENPLLFEADGRNGRLNIYLVARR